MTGRAKLMAAVELAAALGFADEDPVRAAVGGAVEARGFAEGFEQDGADGVASAPVVGQASFDLGEEVRGEVGDAYPGQDQEAGVVDHEGQVALPGFGGPADEAVAGRGLPGGGAEPNRARGSPSAARAK